MKRNPEDYYKFHEVNGEEEAIMSQKGLLLFIFRTYKDEVEEKPREVAKLFIDELANALKMRGHRMTSAEIRMNIRTSDNARLYDIVDEIDNILSDGDAVRIINKVGGRK